MVLSPRRSVGLIAWGAGETKDEAIVKVQSAVADRVAHGEILQAHFETPPLAAANDPWEAMAGRFADDPDWDAFEAELCRIRAEANRA
jgi:hypothetical protein